VSPGIVGGSARSGRDEGAPAVPLAERERKIWDLLGVEPLHIDPIARQIGLSVAQAAEVLLRLELMGLVKQLPGTLFVRKPPAR